MSGLGLGLGVGLGQNRVVVAGEPESNPNLLLWTEQFDNAAWVKTGAVIVTPDAGTDPLGGSTADQIANVLISSRVAQTSSVATASGTGSTVATLDTAAWVRFSVTVTFDTGIYTFSVWLQDPLAFGASVQLFLESIGGFARCSLKDTGDSAVYLAWGAKLETGPSATGSEADYGANP